MTDQRPDPDALLRELKLKEETRTGKLKIFFGYAAGVGKTYAMLEAAHHAKEMGVDVVAGYIEPHVRPETLAPVSYTHLFNDQDLRFVHRCSPPQVVV